MPLSHSRISIHPLTERNLIYFADDCGWFLANSDRFCGRGATLFSRDPLLGPNNFTLGHLLKTEWFGCLCVHLSDPLTERNVIFYRYFRRFLTKSGRFSGQEEVIK